MGPIEFALLAILVFATYLAYKVTTQRLALSERDKMVPVVRDILADENSPEQLKLCGLAAFNASASAEFLPWLIRQLFSSQKGERTKQLKDEHQRILNGLVREHFFRVNLLAAPHWYVVAMLLFFLLVLLSVPFFVFAIGRQNVYALFAKIERTFFHPKFPSDKNLANS